jgi:hypothetical protein
MLATPESNPLEEPNGLACRWFDRRTGRPEVSVFIRSVSDIERTLAGLREEVSGEGPYDPGMASEVSGLAPGEYLFLRSFTNSVIGIIGNCRVSVHPPGDYPDLAQLVDPVIEIGRNVGCSTYVDDFVRPPFPAEWPKVSWGIDEDDRPS